VAATAVRIESDPPGADVLIDGALIGQTPLSVPRPSVGERAILVRQRGFSDARVLVLPTTDAVVSVALERARRGTPTASMQTVQEPAMQELPPPMTESMTVHHTSDVVDPWE
jgi:hypothetical protein